MSAEIQAHIIVSGMVQGVGYRFFVAAFAKRTWLTGWVKNLFFGEVEIPAEGPVGSLVRDLWTGNPYASVRSVRVEGESAPERIRNSRSPAESNNREFHNFI
jgi:acylphosphatase